MEAPLLNMLKYLFDQFKISLDSSITKASLILQSHIPLLKLTLHATT